MKRMTVSLLTLVLLAPTVSAAPAPDRAKEKLEAMKKKLPEVVGKWHKKYWCSGGSSEVKVARQTSPMHAKVTVLVPGVDATGQPWPGHEEAIAIYLSFYDGTWTSSRCQIGSRVKDRESAVLLLMLAIDELGDK